MCFLFFSQNKNPYLLPEIILNLFMYKATLLPQFLLVGLMSLLSCKGPDSKTTAPKDSLSMAASIENKDDKKKIADPNFGFVLDSLLRFNSEEELRLWFKDKVQHSTGYYPEGQGEYQNTLIYPGTPDEVEFVWEDDSVNFKGVQLITVQSTGSKWKTSEGVAIGTKLTELEALNQKPFSFSGFGWDYGGGVFWQEGALSKRNFFVSLDMPADQSAPDGLVGDQEIKSDSKLARQFNPVVVRISMRKEGSDN
jgi:hypothetical protein